MFIRKMSHLYVIVVLNHKEIPPKNLLKFRNYPNIVLFYNLIPRNNMKKKLHQPSPHNTPSPVFQLKGVKTSPASCPPLL